MSHDATNWAIKQRGIKPAAKIVLWHLCDRYHPDHGCFPSLDTLAEDCEMSRRSVQDQIGQLEAAGLLQVEKMPRTAGRMPRNRYRLAFEPDFHLGQNLPLEESALGKSEHPPLANSRNHLGQNLPTNPVRVTSKRTSKIEGADEALSILSQEASAQAAASFVAYRKKTKGGALTATAAARLAATLRQISQLGHDPDDALGMAEERGWQTVKLDWYLRETSSEQHRPSLAIRNRTSHGRQDGFDPALEQIARLAGLS